MGLFKKKKKTEPKPVPPIAYAYTQTENYRGFKRIKLSSYGYKPAQDGIHALTGSDLTGAEIQIRVFRDDAPRCVVVVGGYEIGTVWQHSFDQFDALSTGKVEAIRVEIRDGESFLFYKV